MTNITTKKLVIYSQGQYDKVKNQLNELNEAHNELSVEHIELRQSHNRLRMEHDAEVSRLEMLLEEQSRVISNLEATIAVIVNALDIATLVPPPSKLRQPTKIQY